MSERRYFTDEHKAELLSNPYTVRVTNCKVTFNLAFKQFVMENVDKPGMTARRIFELAGYSNGLFTPGVMRYVIKNIRKEAASPEGLKEPMNIRESVHRKKHSETEFRELQQRVTILEQQIDFLKKSQSLKNKKSSKPPTNSG